MPNWKLMGLLVLLSATALRAHAQELPSVPACQGVRWIVNSGSLKQSQAALPLESQRRFLDSPCTFMVVGKHVDPDYSGWRALQTRSITSLSALKGALGDDSVRAVLYDPEAWPMTPPAEQQHPVAAACQAAQAAHAEGKLLIATPAVDLIRILAPGEAGDGRRFDAFERTGIAAGMAKCVDVYEIQAQAAETDVAKFHDFVAAEAAAARAANPKVLVLAGISTNPQGRRVTADQLYAAVESVRGLVDGFWLNIPAGGKFCPSCGEPQPQVAAALLARLPGMPSG